MFATGETNKLFVFAAIVIGAALSFHAAYTLAKVDLALGG
jgi:hypothetical protein